MADINDRWDTRPRLQRMADVLSQLLNVWLLDGMTDESISGRCWRNTRYQLKPKLRWKILAALAELLFYPIDKGDHCRLAFWQDIERCKERVVSAKRFINQQEGDALL